MNIAVYIHSLGVGGAERVTCHIANHWLESGHEVTIITNRPSPDTVYFLNSSVNTLCLNVYGSRELGIQRVYDNLRRCYKLRKVLQKMKIVSAVSMGSTASVTLALAGLGIKTKTIGSERNFPPRKLDGRHWGFLRKHVYRFLDTVVVQSNKTETWIRKNTNARSICVIPNPVIFPLASLPPIKEPRITKDIKLLIGVGSLHEQKQFDHLIRAFGAIVKTQPGWMLAIIGEGNLRLRLESQIEEMQLSHKICLPGKVGNISDWYDRADLFALTSKYEGFPNVLLEAMSHGIPSVCYNCDTGPSDIVTDGMNGILVTPNNEKLLIKSLSLLMSNHILRKEMGKAALQVRARFSKSEVFNLWDRVIPGI